MARNAGGEFHPTARWHVLMRRSETGATPSPSPRSEVDRLHRADLDIETVVEGAHAFVLLAAQLVGAAHGHKEDGAGAIATNLVEGRRKLGIHRLEIDLTLA